MDTIIGKTRRGEKATFRAAHSPNFGCVGGTKKSFLDFLAGNYPVQPLAKAVAVAVARTVAGKGGGAGGSGCGSIGGDIDKGKGSGQ